MNNGLYKILVACDKFKGSVNAETATKMLAKGMKRAGKNLRIIKLPLADGGEGSGQVFSNHQPVKRKRIKTVNAVRKPLWMTYLEDEKGRFFVESCQVTGPGKLKSEEKDPKQTSTFGLGLCLQKLLKKGAKDLHVFLGGSATNDGGSGMLEGLGWTFYDKNGKILHPRGGNLMDIHDIKKPDVDLFSGVSITAWCDVDIPLLGPRGCSFMFAGQKGADPDDIKFLEKGMIHFQGLMSGITGKKNDYLAPGAGSAGGLGFAIYSGLGGNLGQGAAFFAELVDLEKEIRKADLVITGEGSLDMQSTRGKVISQVISLTGKHHTACIVACGENLLDEAFWKKLGIQKVYSIMDLTGDKENAIRCASDYLFCIGEKIIYDVRLA